MSRYFYLHEKESGEAIKVVAVVGGSPGPRTNPNVLTAFLSFHALKDLTWIDEDSDYYSFFSCPDEVKEVIKGRYDDSTPLLCWNFDNYKELLKRNKRVEQGVNSLQEARGLWVHPGFPQEK